ncbi:hypothetical protein [Luteitalea pratensis]|nr:hypothetical protein [Luteitalea pratensis]
MSPQMAATVTVAVVTGVNATPVSTLEQRTIGTWYEVGVDRVLRRGGSEDVGVCQELRVPEGIRAGQDRWALWLPGGTIVVDGVRIAHRFAGEQGHLQPGQKYLVLGRDCGSTFEPLYGREGVYHVDGDMRLRRFRITETTLTEFIEALGNVDGVHRWLEHRARLR